MTIDDVSELIKPGEGPLASLENELDSGARPDPLVLVIFGASGDLTHRKLLPALAQLAERRSLPTKFVIVGVARTQMSERAFRELCAKAAPKKAERWQALTKKFRYVVGDYDHPDTFAALSKMLGEIEIEDGTAGNRMYYLAIVPSLFSEVAQGLADQKLNEPGNGGSFSRLVIEKPFGADLKSAIALDVALHRGWQEEQIFRIDHYMGKETVLNLLALRFANSIFEPIWNRRYVDHIQVTVAEDLGVEHRGGFYEHAGAMRDIVQNHVMQVLALTLMEPPATLEASAIRDEKVKLLRSIVLPGKDGHIQHVVRAQYGKGTIDGVEVPAYREEEGVSARSKTETYVAMALAVENWRWAGVPIFVRTGKRLAARATEVAMFFQRPPHLAFVSRLAADLQPDSLMLRIQPDEGISLHFGAKVPGPAFKVATVSMDFAYSKAFPGASGDAYERLLLDAMIGDPMLFIRSDEVDQAWRIVEPILDQFASDEVPLSRYPAGSWGPKQADEMIATTGREWHNPQSGTTP